MQAKLKVAVITNIIPSYRRDYYRRIFDNPSIDVVVYCQESIPGMNLSSIHHEFGEKVLEVAYWGMNREKLGWQWLPIGALLRNFDVYFILGNPRVLSNWMISILLRMLGKRVVIQGQLHTAGSFGILQRIRLFWWRMFRYLYLYNDEEVARLTQKSGFAGKTMIGMNNGLDQNAINSAIQAWPNSKLQIWRQRHQLERKQIILSCARLEPKNNFEWMIESLPVLVAQFPKLLWCVIGDGHMKSALLARAESLGVSQHIRWLGAIYEESELAPWFLSSKVLIHPGAIGLSLLHAFGYGLPVITHDDRENHMPEFDALLPGKNGSVFRYGDLQALQENLAALLTNEEELARLSVQARETAVTRYNTRIMAERFARMCHLAAEKKCLA